MTKTKDTEVMEIYTCQQERQERITGFFMFIACIQIIEKNWNNIYSDLVLGMCICCVLCIECENSSLLLTDISLKQYGNGTQF